MTSSLLLSITTFCLPFVHGISTFREQFFALSLYSARYGHGGGYRSGANGRHWFSLGRVLPDWAMGMRRLSNLYESLVFASWAIMVIYLVFEWRTRQRPLGVFPALFSFLAMAYASFSKDMDSKIQPLVPALKSNWLIAHVITCFLGYAAFAVSFGLSILLSCQKGLSGQPQPTRRPGLGCFTECQATRIIQLPDDPLRISLALCRYNNRLDLGKFGVGHLLELGPQGDMVSHNLADLCGPAARTHYERLAGGKSSLVVHAWFWVCSIYLFWGKLPVERLA